MSLDSNSNPSSSNSSTSTSTSSDLSLESSSKANLDALYSDTILRLETTPICFETQCPVKDYNSNTSPFTVSTDLGLKLTPSKEVKFSASTTDSCPIPESSSGKDNNSNAIPTDVRSKISYSTLDIRSETPSTMELIIDCPFKFDGCTGEIV